MELNPRELEDLKGALLAAFPSKDALQQMVFFKLGENLDVITSPGNLGTIVSSLIQWAIAEDRLEELLRGACDSNPRNPKLKLFCARLGSQTDAHPPDPVFSQLRQQLIDALQEVPATATYMGRTALLGSVADSGSLNRNSDNMRTDIELIVDQLRARARRNTDDRSLSQLLENAIAHVKGIPLADDLRALQQQLM